MLRTVTYYEKYLSSQWTSEKKRKKLFFLFLYKLLFAFQLHGQQLVLLVYLAWFYMIMESIQNLYKKMIRIEPSPLCYFCEGDLKEKV